MAPPRAAGSERSTPRGAESGAPAGDERGTPRDPARATLRAFFAIEPSAQARTAAGALLRSLREGPGGDRVRWVREENLHVTLRFLGDLAADAVDPLLGGVAAQTAALAPFSLRLGTPHAFPPRRPRVIALEVLPFEPVAELYAAVERGVVEAGFPPETRRFRAHLTLGRVRPRRTAPDVTASDTPLADAFRVTEAVLFQSELRPGGSRYTALGRAPLGSGR